MVVDVRADSRSGLDPVPKRPLPVAPGTPMTRSWRPSAVVVAHIDDARLSFQSGLVDVV